MMIQRVFFCHIPKTAGTSFMVALASQYEPKDISPARLLTHLKDDISAIENKLLIGGHFGVDDVGREKLKDFYKVTFLRDPIERILSLYYFWNSHMGKYSGSPESDPNYKGVKLAIDSSIETFLSTADPSVLAEISNTQCRYIIGSAKLDFTELTDEEIFDRAKRAIKHDYNFVGLLETYEKSLGKFLRSAGIARSVEMLDINKHAHPTKYQVPNTVLDRITTLNRADIMLHEYVLRAGGYIRREHEFVSKLRNTFQFTPESGM